METIEILKNKRNSAYLELRKTFDMYESIRITYEAMKKQYFDAKEAFERVDYALAEIDGRLEKVEERKSGKRDRLDKEEEAKAFIAELSPAEFRSMLAELGVTLPEVEEVPLPEDVKLPKIVDVGD
jgi:chromosome segregation ATPase